MTAMNMPEQASSEIRAQEAEARMRYLAAELGVVRHTRRQQYVRVHPYEASARLTALKRELEVITGRFPIDEGDDR